ncbi:MAG: helicase, partial [Pedobacter sp.]
KLDQDILHQQVKKDTEDFLKSYLLQCFDLGPLDNMVYEHVHSYTKDIHKSAKQKHHKWAEKLLKSIIEVRANASKFLAQISRLSQDSSPAGLKILLERVHAAEAYFTPLLNGFSEHIFERMELVKQDKQILEFLAELLEMEARFYECFKKMKKAPALLASILENKDFKRADVEKLINITARTERMLKVFAMDGTDDFTQKKGAKSKSSKAKKPGSGAPKIDTKEVTLGMFNEGKTIGRIAVDRKMTPGTIEAHLAHYVALGEISAKKIIGAAKLDKILKAIKDLKTIKLNDLRDKLGREYSFSEIKIGIASHLADGQD